MRLLFVPFTVIVLICSAWAEERPGIEPATVEEVNSNPANYQGKTLLFKGVQVSGHVVEGPKQVRLAVKSSTGMLIDSKLHKDGISFVMPKEKATQMHKDWKPGEFYAVTLTCEVEKSPKGFWLAVVHEVGSDKANSGSPIKDVAERKKKGNKKHAESNAAIVSIIASGSGKTEDEALKQAFRHAVSQVVGAMVDAETVVKNDDVISDKILTYSAGIVKKYDELKKNRVNGRVEVEIRAWVERGEVQAKLKAANITTKDVDGGSIFSTVVTEVENEKRAKELLESRFKGFPANCVRTEPVGSPKVIKREEAETTLEYTIRVAVNEKKYDTFVKAILPVLEGCTKRKGEIHSERDQQWEQKYKGIESRRNRYIESDPRTQASAWFIRDIFPKWQSVEVIPSKLMVIRNNDYQAGMPEFWRSRADDGMDNGHMFMIVNASRTKLDDRITWKWYIIPNLSKLDRTVVIKTSLTDDKDTEITFDHLEIATIGMAVPDLRSVYNRHAFLAPYVHVDSQVFFRSMDIAIKCRVATEDLRRIHRIRCQVIDGSQEVPKPPLE
jgi:hypothetical protein